MLRMSRMVPREWDEQALPGDPQLSPDPVCVLSLPVWNEPFTKRGPGARADYRRELVESLLF